MDNALKTALRSANRWDAIKTTLEAYGRSLSDAGEIIKGDTPSGVVLALKGPRIQARSTSGGLLWSGADVASFLESFWFAKRVSA